MVSVKICGFTVREDIKDALALGIKIIGINFCSKSPRYVSPAKAENLLMGLPEDIIVIGVFVNPGERTLLETVSGLNLSGIQLHGDEPEEFIGRFKKTFPGKIVIKGIRVENTGMLSRSIKTYNPDFFLLDAYSKKAKGGTGERIDYSCLKDIILPWNKIFFAGGITPGNVKGLLKQFSPYGIDVASGVEISPGKKDREKIRLLLENIKNG